MLKKILQFLMSTYKKTKSRKDIFVSIQKPDYSNKTRVKNPRNGRTMTWSSSRPIHEREPTPDIAWRAKTQKLDNQET